MQASGLWHCVMAWQFCKAPHVLQLSCGDQIINFHACLLPTFSALPADLGLSKTELPLLLADNLRDALVESFLSNSGSLSLDMCDILRIKFIAAVDSKTKKKV